VVAFPTIEGLPFPVRNFHDVELPVTEVLGAEIDKRILCATLIGRIAVGARKICLHRFDEISGRRDGPMSTLEIGQ
jgi:hypothetical protein